MPQIQITAITELRLNQDNPRVIKDDKFKKLVKSIQEFPQMLEIRPIVVNDEMVVLGGNMRLKACIEAGLTEVPIIKASSLTPEQQKEFIIKDNVGFGEWEWDVLANEWDVKKLTDWGLDIPDYEPKVLEAKEDGFEVPETVQTDIVLGDLFEIGEHRLLCGDSTDSDQVAKLMNGQKADLVLTDPPYGIGYEYDKHKDNDNDANAKLVSDVFALHQCGKVWTPGLMNLSRDIQRFGNTKVAVWYKKFAQAGNGVGGASTWEPILIVDPPKKKLDNDVIELMVEKEELYGKSLREFHSCPKPVKLYAKLVESFTDINDLIFEPFCGSGTTMISAHQLKRRCFGIEMSEKYCQVIIDRMRKLDPSLIIKKNGVVTEYAI
jgi:DNA modification methylase